MLGNCHERKGAEKKVAAAESVNRKDCREGKHKVYNAESHSSQQCLRVAEPRLLMEN